MAPRRHARTQSELIPRRTQREHLFRRRSFGSSSHIRGRELSATLDTGAVTTDLYAALTKSIPSRLQEGSAKTATEVRGAAGDELFESITVPELTIGLEGLDTVLRPAHVLLKQLGPSYCVGNLGLDLLRQAESFTIDFDALRLELQRKP
jgi:predicted aspartyl protease